jgi:hypothetical protein
MRVRMKQTIRGSRDGVAVETFEAGSEVEFGLAPREQELLQVFLREGWAEEVRARPAAPENESRGDAPENAAASGAPQSGRRRR